MHVVEGELNFGWESRRKFVKDAAFGIKLYGILDSVHRTRRERPQTGPTVSKLESEGEQNDRSCFAEA